MTSRSPSQLPERPWSVPVAVDQVSEIGRHFDLVADEATRGAVARLAGLRALPRLEAQFDVNRHGREGLHVVGHVGATVGQVCSVSLDPIENEIDEPIDLIFSPDAAPAVVEETGEVRRRVEVTTDEGPEALVNGVVDLAALAVEFLILAVDPYPRKPDAVFEARCEDDEPNRPFAALGALKKDERP